MMQFGGHVRRENPIVESAARGADIAQIFLGDPQSWKKPTSDYDGGAAALRADAQEAGIGLYVHSPYIINVASTNNRIRIPSRKILQQAVTEAAVAGARGVVVHGGHVTANDDPEAGYTNWRKAVDGLKLDVPIFIENTAGGANAMARTLEAIGRTWDAIAGSDNIDMVGFCLDTCHAHAGGEELVGLVERIKGITGRIDLVHCNDSRDAFDSGADRHANLGQGQVDPEGLVEVVRLAGASVVLETPGDAQVHSVELDYLKEQLA